MVSRVWPEVAPLSSKCQQWQGDRAREFADRALGERAHERDDRDDALVNRVTELEIKLTFTEALVDKLDAVVIDQQHRIDQLAQEMVRLREQLSTAAEAGSGAPAHERPPHY
ncbi:MAG: SlyX family protein [Burkholderiales bacterium]